jgi:hypothetical protein
LLVKQDIQSNILQGVVSLSVEVVTLPENKIIIQTNTHGEVVGFNGVVTTDLQWNGHSVDASWDCSGMWFFECKNIINSWFQEQPDSGSAGNYLNCYNLQRSPKVYIDEQDAVTFSETTYNNDTQKYEDHTLDQASSMFTILILQNEATSFVQVTPHIAVTLAPNYPMESVVSAAGMQSDMGSETASDEASFPYHKMGSGWWYGVPFFVSLALTWCCCFSCYFLCCIPVKDIRPHEKDGFVVEIQMDNIEDIEKRVEEKFGGSDGSPAGSRNGSGSGSGNVDKKPSYKF